MVAPLVRTSVCTKPGKSFAATSFDGFGGSSGKDMAFMSISCFSHEAPLNGYPWLGTTGCPSRDPRSKARCRQSFLFRLLTHGISNLHGRRDSFGFPSLFAITPDPSGQSN